MIKAINEDPSTGLQHLYSDYQSGVEVFCGGMELEMVVVELCIHQNIGSMSLFLRRTALVTPTSPRLTPRLIPLRLYHLLMNVQATLSFVRSGHQVVCKWYPARQLFFNHSSIHMISTPSASKNSTSSATSVLLEGKDVILKDDLNINLLSPSSLADNLLLVQGFAESLQQM